LVEELGKLGVAAEQVEHVARGLAIRCANARAAIASQREKALALSAQMPDANTAAFVNGLITATSDDTGGEVVSVTHSAFSLKFRVRTEVCEQLRRRYDAGGGDPQWWAVRLFALLARYAALDGEGYQGSLSTALMDRLRVAIGVQGECFASPLNVDARSRYFSAFPLVDRFFGSAGSFFSLHRTIDLIEEGGGSFEANPPFLEEIILAMYMYMHVLLDRYAAVPLSFCVFVPRWTDTPGVEAMTASPFTTAQFHLDKRTHSYRAGFHHLPHRNVTIPYSNTLVFLLQNEKGADRWKASELTSLFQGPSP